MFPRCEMQFHWALRQIAAMQYAAVMGNNQQAPPQAVPPAPVPTSSRAETNNDVESDNAEQDEENRTIFCANLDDRVTEEILYELFIQAGPIDSVRIPKDNQGRKRNFGFIIYAHECSAPYAMHIYQGLSLFRKQIIIKYKGSHSLPRLSTTVPFISEDPKRSHRRVSPSARYQYDNTALRNSSFPATSTQNSENSRNKNPSSQETPQWLLGSSTRHASRNDRYDRNDQHRSSPVSSRHRNNSAPYSRNGSHRADNERIHNHRTRDRNLQGSRYYCDDNRR